MIKQISFAPLGQCEQERRRGIERVTFAQSNESPSRRPGDTIKTCNREAGRDTRVSFVPPGQHDQERQRSGGPRRAIKRVSFAPPGRREQERRRAGELQRAIEQVTFAQSNESPSHRPGDTIKSCNREAGRDTRVSFAPPGRQDQERRQSGGPQHTIEQVSFAPPGQRKQER